MSEIDYITIAVPVLNEEDNLPKCLESLKDFEHVVIIDSGSTDNTLKLCESFRRPVITFNWNGKFPKKRNWFLEQFEIKTEWVLFLDADEVLTDKFISALPTQRHLESFDGFWLRYTNFFLGKKMKFGFPQKKLALIRRSFRYEKIDINGTSKFDMEIHEHPVGLERVGELRTPILHNDYKGLKKFVEKHLVYAEWEAERANGAVKKQFLTKRQKVKYALINSRIFAMSYFFMDYVVMLRLIDGYPGFMYSFYKAWYFSMVRELVSERHRNESDITPDPE
jgi:glycosyltransferase involved in cell wall biosynthesis